MVLKATSTNCIACLGSRMMLIFQIEVMWGHRLKSMANSPGEECGKLTNRRVWRTHQLKTMANSPLSASQTSPTIVPQRSPPPTSQSYYTIEAYNCRVHYYVDSPSIDQDKEVKEQLLLLTLMDSRVMLKLHMHDPDTSIASSYIQMAFVNIIVRYMYIMTWFCEIMSYIIWHDFMSYIIWHELSYYIWHEIISYILWFCVCRTMW